MAGNCTCPGVSVWDMLSSQPGALPTLLGLGGAASIGMLGFCSILLYLRRLCTGKDVISDCIIGRSRVHLEVDTDGDGRVDASKRIVYDANTRRMRLLPTGLPDSPPPAAPHQAVQDREASEGAPAASEEPSFPTPPAARSSAQAPRREFPAAAAQQHQDDEWMQYSQSGAPRPSAAAAVLQAVREPVRPLSTSRAEARQDSQPPFAAAE